MEFEWDPVKAARNAEKHGITFSDAASVWHDPERLESPAFSVVEHRMLTIGMVAGQVLTVVFTLRQPNLARIISARFASRQERRRYASA